MIFLTSSSSQLSIKHPPSFSEIHCILAHTITFSPSFSQIHSFLTHLLHTTTHPSLTPSHPSLVSSHPSHTPRITHSLPLLLQPVKLLVEEWPRLAGQWGVWEGGRGGGAQQWGAREGRRGSGGGGGEDREIPFHSRLGCSFSSGRGGARFGGFEATQSPLLKDANTNMCTCSLQ